MQLVINSYGASLRRDHNCFVISDKEKKFEVSADKVEGILISTSAFLSTDAIACAIEHNIDIVFLDGFGNPYGRVWHCKLGSTTLIRRKQLEASLSESGTVLACSFIIEKLKNQIQFLKDLKKNRDHHQDELERSIHTIDVQLEKISSITGIAEEVRDRVMGHEGLAAVSYFQILSVLLPEKFRFKGMSRNPAKDEFNCLLNYGYGILYSHVEKACIISGIDPYVGILHVDGYNKKSFVFDLIEQYRISIDRIVFGLFISKKVKTDYFDLIPGGMTLNKEGKVILISAVNEMFDRKIRYKGRDVSYKNIIPLDCHHIANSLIKKGE
jgi:CRISP-associated protein Cas1